MIDWEMMVDERRRRVRGGVDLAGQERRMRTIRLSDKEVEWKGMEMSHLPQQIVCDSFRTMESANPSPDEGSIFLVKAGEGKNDRARAKDVGGNRSTVYLSEIRASELRSRKETTRRSQSTSSRHERKGKELTSYPRITICKNSATCPYCVRMP